VRATRVTRRAREPADTGISALFAAAAVRMPRTMLLGALVFAILCAAFGLATPRLLGRASNDFVAQGSESVRAQAVVERASGLSASPQLLVLVHDPTPRRLARVERIVGSEPLFPQHAPPLYSRDRGAALVAAYARAGVSEARWRQAADRVAVRLGPVPGTAAGGAAIGTSQVNRQVQQDLTHAEELAFPVLFVLALIVFGSGVAALLPLVCGALTILGALLLLRLLDLATPISTYALNIVTGAGLGLAIDYSLLLVSRYREELARRGPGAAAVRATVATAGRTVAFSSVTVGVAIATLAVFPLGFLRSMGIAGALVGPLAGLVSLTVLPPLFFVLGPRINALPVRRQAGAPRDRGAWYHLAHALMRRPVPYAALAATVLILAGLPFTSIRFTGIDASVLPEGVSSRAVDDALRTEFRSASVSPAYAVVRGSARDAAAYARAVRALPGARVVLPPRRLGRTTWEVAAASGEPFLEPASLRMVRGMRALPSTALVGGATAQFLDQKRAIIDGLPLAIGLLCIATFILLYIATRSLILPLKTLLMNALSISATLGILVAVFQAGRFESVLNYRGQGALQLTVPVLIFAISFGLATDYGVFLLTRIKEEWDSGLPNDEAVAVGLERTGRIVTAAALLFCIAIGAFATSNVILIKEVGIGIALAVAIDATIVRAILVPSLMGILGRWNWWPGSAKHDEARKEPRVDPEGSGV
jgi:RND superfamily putative drug exporter